MKVSLHCFIALCLLSNIGFAKNLGQYGHVFPVIEEDIRKVIMARLSKMEKSGELQAREEEVSRRVSEHIIRPKALSLTTTITPQTFTVNPSIQVNHDLYTPNGVLLAHAGDKINPFDVITFSKTLLFFNGDDKLQVAWVQKHYQAYQPVKLILTGGDIREAASHFGRIYFDIDGRLTTQLHLQHVPSVVRQKGRFWGIQEIGTHDA